MKKYLMFIAAALTLAACQKGQPTEVPAADDNSISFGAYTTTSSQTKGSVVTASGDIFGTGDKKGIGVFAFYEPSATGDFNTYKYATPDFMYNEQVTTTDDGATWSYSPLKYWPNNTGDKVSFFAYAPYDKSKTWEDLGIKTDINASKLTVTFPIADNANDQQDQLWAAPQLDLSKPNTTAKVNFDFTHITSQVNLFVGVETDAAGHTPGAWPAEYEKTEIEIKSIEFKDLSSSMTYSYALPITADPTVTASSEKQSVILTSSDFEDAARVINTTNYASNKLLTSGFKKLNKSTSTMFLVPEALSKAVVTYTVTTEDAKLGEGESVVTNVVECTLPSAAMVAQKVYNLQFLIGMTSVKVSASVYDWDSPAVDEQINAPVVNYQDYLYNGYSITVKSEDETKGTVSSTLSGSELTLTATPTNSGYYALDKWVDEDNNEVTTIPVDLSSPAITKDKTYTAKFKDVPLFSVSDTKTVQFTKGNLYWDGSASAWGLESSQTAYPTSWDANHVGHFFWTKTAAASYAESYDDGTCTTSDVPFFAESTGGLTVDGQSGLYALNKDEWTYLIKSRTNASNLYKYGVTVSNGGTNYSNCLIIAPDGYTGTLASSYTLDEVNASGLVCLPAAGSRVGASVLDGGSYGFYWSSTPYGGYKNLAYRLDFDDSNVDPSNGNYRSYGYSVRLVWSPSN